MAIWQGGSNLDTMRSASPQLPNAYQPYGTLPPAGYDDPKPGNTSNFDSYLTRMSLRGNATGVAGSQPMQAADPTAGASAVGGFSYNLDSNNYNISLPALSLPGRAGLGTSLALNYNSKVWTQDANTNTMIFNGDRGFPAPGWQLGFGSVVVKSQANPPYSNSTTGKSSIIYVSSDGARHDLAYNSTTASFDSYDSSYLKFESATRILRLPNGTQVTFGEESYANNDARFLPTMVKDRNGNYFNINYRTLDNGVKALDYVIDTAGRRIDFNYESNRLTSISQNRGGATFYFVRIDYSPVTIKTRFVAPLAADPANINNTAVYFPTRITYPTGVNYRFGYTSYGQINVFQKWVPAVSGQGVERSVAQTSLTGLAHCVDLNAPPNSPDYCNPVGDLPRIYHRLESAENWQGGQAQTYQYNGGGFDISDPTGRRFLVQTNGMTQSVSIFAPNAGTFTKKDEATFTSDTGLSYLSNLRVIETKNTALTGSSYQVKTRQVSYIQLDGMWLPATANELINGSVYRQTVTEYTSYPAQYILGLPQQVSVYAGAGVTLLSRVSNSYDQTSTFVDSNGQTAGYFIDASGDGAIQHDDANYGGGFTVRGNLTSVTQHSVVNGTITGSRIAKRVSYDTNGNVRGETDAAGNRRQIVYTDNYTNKPAGVGVTCVYPYTSADPTGFRSGSEWNYYTGQTTKSFNLLPGGGTELQAVTTSYDFADRPELTTRPDGGWAKTSYWDNWLAVATSQQTESGKVRYKFEMMDGAGRAIKKASDHPDGASGKFAGQITVYDNTGQVTDSSNVLAVDAYWIPGWEDQGKQFLFTHLTRDELARLKIITFPDNNTRQVDYTGCGCAGNSETRATDELGHQTITKTDALSRLVEAVEPDDSLASGIYSKAQYFYDALDRLTEIRHSDTTGAKIQYRTFSYDGYGRLSSETTPEGGTVNYTYTANDQVWQVSNQRNITVAHTYNTRGLVTNISYSDSTPQVVYNYDAYGARSSVTYCEGQTSYSYNGYRQLQSETRNFTGLSGKSYTLNYSYNQADQVKSVNYLVTIPGGTPGPPVTIQGDGGSGSCDTCSISGQVTNLQSQPVSQVTMTLSGAQSGQTTTNSNGQYSFGGLAAGETYTITPSQSGQVFDPSSRIYQNLSTEITNANFTMQPQTVTVFDKTINYAYNSVGALNSIGTNLIGTDPNNTTNVLNSVTFRATGALKQLNYGNGRRLTMGYNDQRNQPTSMKVDRISNPSDVAVDYEYEYYDANGNNNNRIRKVTDKYDPGYTTTYLYDKFNRLTNATATNYSRFYQFDPWGNITNFSGVTLNYAASGNGAPSTNRINTDSQSFSYSYDAAGNMTAGMGQSFTYDGANRLKTAGNGNSSFGYDGDGMRVKKSENGANTFYVKSSVLGQTAMEVNSTGVVRAFVYSGGKMVAMQGTDGQFYWLHTNHLGNARTMTDTSGNVAYGGQFDPYGQPLAEWSATGNTTLNTKKFTGYERDAATGLDYAQARMYNSSRGRFTSPDPIGFRGINLKNPGSLNRYNYAGNDPVNFVDPNGETYQHWQDAIARSACQSNGGIWVLVGFNSTGVPIFNCSGVLGSIGVTSIPGNSGNGTSPSIPATLRISVTAPGKLKPGSCGGAEYTVQWNIQGATSATKGWIIQHVKMTSEAFDRDGKPVKAVNLTTEFWEAWYVEGDKVYDGFKSGGVGGKDTYNTRSEKEGTWGTINIVGSVKFIEGYSLETPPWSVHAGVTGDLPSIFKSELPNGASPPGWNESGTQNHSMKVQWDCAGVDRPNEVSTTP